LVAATERLSEHIQKQLNNKSRNIDHLNELYSAITGKLAFTSLETDQTVNLQSLLESNEKQN